MRPSEVCSPLHRPAIAEFGISVTEGTKVLNNLTIVAGIGEGVIRKGDRYEFE